jgi:hypothetical protein
MGADVQLDDVEGKGQLCIERSGWRAIELKAKLIELSIYPRR